VAVLEIGIIMQSPAPNWVAASAGAKLGLSLAKRTCLAKHLV